MSYDPFIRGRFAVGVRTIQAHDSRRDRFFPCEIWYPVAAEYAGRDLAAETCDVFPDAVSKSPRKHMAVRDAKSKAGRYPLILFSHSGGSDRRQSTFLCTHLSSHGYVVAAMDHSERVAAELVRKSDETEEKRSVRWGAVIANRVPDISFLLHHLLHAAWDWEIQLDPDAVGIAGHSFGGWTALAATEVERTIRAVVALAPAGASQRKPGILPVKLSFHRDRDVPILYLVAENDSSLPLSGMHEIFERTPGTKRMVILHRADHLHFMDEFEVMHENFRTMPVTPELAEIQKDMLPITELCTREQAHLFSCGLTLCHFDATLRQHADAIQFWNGDIEAKLKRRGVDANHHQIP